MASIVSAGTTSATALNMSADTSGILQLASNNGTVALTVSTAQNIGFGTTSPAYKIDAQGASNNGSPILSLTATSLVNATFNWASQAFAATMPSNSNFLHFIGKAATTGDSGYVGFKHTGTGASVNNCMTLGTYGNDNLLNVCHGGWVTTPQQPAFNANNGPATQTTGVIVFSSTRVNTGSDYSTGTGTFTAPVDGVYVFAWQVYKDTGMTSPTSIFFERNGSALYEGLVAGGLADYVSIDGSIVINMAANDTARLTVRQGRIHTNSAYSYFSGMLIG
jgi:hypothetical protein